MIKLETSLVAKITLKTNTYYVTDRSGITLDSNEYLDVVLGWGDWSGYGNIGNGQKQKDTIDGMVLNNGEEMTDDGYLFDPTDIWNNSEIDIRIWVDGATVFNNLDNYGFGKIKNFNINNNTVAFDIDSTDHRDNTLLPRYVTSDQSVLETAAQSQNITITASASVDYDTGVYTGEVYWGKGELCLLKNSEGLEEYSEITKVTDNGGTVTLEFTPNLSNTYTGTSIIEKPFLGVPKDFINKTIPMQYGDLSDEDGGFFGKTLTIDGRANNKAIISDNFSLYQVERLGVWDPGPNRFYKSIKFIEDTTTLAVAATAGDDFISPINSGLFPAGCTIRIAEGSTSEIVTAERYDAFDIAYNNSNSVKISIEENLSNSYTTAATLSRHIGEYEHSTGNNHTLFRKDFFVELKDSYSTNATDEITQLQLKTGHAKLIPWQDENKQESKNVQETISQIVVSIDSEQMLVAYRPDYTNDYLYVERGYNGTTKAVHATGSTVYVNESFSGKNLLPFRDLFAPNGACNHNTRDNSQFAAAFPLSYKNPTLYTGPGGGASNMFDRDPTTYFDYVQNWDWTAELPIELSSAVDGCLTMALQFDNIDIDATVYSVKNAIKCEGSLSGDFIQAGGPIIRFVNNVALAISNISGDMTFESDWVDVNRGILYTNAVDGYGTVSGTGFTCNTFDDYNNEGLIEMDSGSESFYRFGMTALKDLNKMPRLFLRSAVWPLNLGGLVTDFEFDYNIKIYQIGLWIDFFIDFTKNQIMQPLKGRMVNQDVIDINGNDPATRHDTLCENPVDVLAHILTQELKYDTLEFSSSWDTVRSYTTNSSNYGIRSPEASLPKCAMSYGVDDKQVLGWEFCQEIAYHFNLQITKQNNNIIDIINLHQIYYNTPIGNLINVEEISFLEDNGAIRASVQQTGSDLIYNDFQIKYSRNNSTGEYQGVYILPDTFVLESGITLAQARTDYFDGKKRTLVIESPYIYDIDDAVRLAETTANDQAEAHMWIDMFIDFWHYSDYNSLSEQYKKGDVIYLVGKLHGVTFTSARKFYIQNAFYRDSGRDLQLQLKSIDPVVSF